MVVLAQALVVAPRYLLVDELSLGLAPVVVERLIPAIAAVAEAGIGVLLIEQFATVALGLANRAYIMEGGRIRYSGPGQRAAREPGAAAVRVPAAGQQTRQMIPNEPGDPPRPVRAIPVMMLPGAGNNRV